MIDDVTQFNLQVLLCLLILLKKINIELQHHWFRRCTSLRFLLWWHGERCKFKIDLYQAVDSYINFRFIIFFLMIWLSRREDIFSQIKPATSVQNCGKPDFPYFLNSQDLTINKNAHIY